MNLFKKSIPKLFILFFVVYWLFLIRPAWSGQLGGTFKSKEVPREYVRLKDFLYNQPEFFRTFWIPKKQRFGFSSNNHPAINSMDFLKISSPSAVINWLKRDEIEEQLARWSVKYVIIPYDSEEEIFLEDRKYDEKKRKKAEEDLRMVRWLRLLDGWEKIAVFETTEFKDKFFINSLTRELANSLIKWKMVNPTKYEVEVKNIDTSFTLVFSESYDKNWTAKIDDKKIYSQKTSDGLNSFVVSGYNGDRIEIEFELQKYVNYGLFISGVTLVVITFLLLFN